MGLDLVVLAAGIGQRFGGLKQLTPVGPGGEAIMDYTVHDALRSGFDRVVLVKAPPLMDPRPRLDLGAIGTDVDPSDC